MCVYRVRRIKGFSNGYWSGHSFLRNHAPVQGLYDLRLLDSDVYAGLSPRGSVCMAGRAGSVVELQRIDGKMFKTTKEAEAHGLELARDWVDQKTAWRSRCPR
jgi:hypothetical protein